MNTLTGQKLPNSSYYYSYKDRYVIDTEHASERIIQRNIDTEDDRKLTISELELLFQRMIDWTIAKNAEVDRKYFFYSRSLRQGVVVKYEKEDPIYHPIDPNTPQFILVTFFPRGRNQINNDQFKSKERRIVVFLEKYQEDVNYSNEFIQYLDEIMKYYGLPTIDNKYNMFNEIKIDKYNTMNITIIENRLWDVNYEVVEID